VQEKKHNYTSNFSKLCSQILTFQNQQRFNSSKLIFSIWIISLGLCMPTSTVYLHLVSQHTKIRIKNLWAGRLGFNSWQRQCWDFFLFATASRLVLGSTQCPIQWILGGFYPMVKTAGTMKLTVCLHVVLRLQTCGAIPPVSQYVFMVWCLVKPRDFTKIRNCTMWWQ
jgi:hypothetical protein